MPTKIPSPLTLSTERLLIRSPKESDGKGLNEAILDSLNELQPWMPWAQNIPTLDDSTANCKKAEADFKEGTDHRLHIFLKDPLTFIGCSGLHKIDWDVPKMEIGYWIRTPFSGKGYMTEAVREITRFGMEELGMNRVEIRMSEHNLKSRAIPERLGFQLDGIIRNDERHMDGTLRNTCIFSRITPARNK